jgi:hypothetical protein
VNAERSRVLGDTQVFDPARLCGQACEHRKAGSRYDQTGNARFFGFGRRPRRGRSACPSSAVTGDERVAPLLLGQRSEVSRVLPLLCRIVAYGRCGNSV